MALCACGHADDEAAFDRSNMLFQQTPGVESIIQCGRDAVAAPLANTPDALKRAIRVYQVIGSAENIVVAFQSSYGKGLSTYTYEEQAEALLILSGLESCGEVGATPEAIALLLSERPSGSADIEQIALTNRQAIPINKFLDFRLAKCPASLTSAQDKILALGCIQSPGLLEVRSSVPCGSR